MASFVDWQERGLDLSRPKTIAPSTWKELRRSIAVNLYETHGWTYEEIGRVFKVTGRRVGQIVGRSIVP